MPIGTVKFFNDSKGYGFIAPETGGNDAFVHISAVEKSGMRTLRENQRVSYELQEDRRGKMAAVNLQDASDTVPVDQAAGEQAEAGDQPAAE
ncbi:cold-shock protein [Sphingomonas lutea]|uniref:Cold-shock protein n=1 Tax=Sphingomonas lutea TaxID=1045317 RepID=A0A7G9SFD7_9SPHN|nr:cold-shock protein [Sphingomonas lutea]